MFGQGELALGVASVKGTRQTRKGCAAPSAVRTNFAKVEKSPMAAQDRRPGVSYDGPVQRVIVFCSALMRWAREMTLPAKRDCAERVGLASGRISAAGAGLPLT